jgi:hypothetical protein
MYVVHVTITDEGGGHVWNIQQYEDVLQDEKLLETWSYNDALSLFRMVKDVGERRLVKEITE